MAASAAVAGGFVLAVFVEIVHHLLSLGALPDRTDAPIGPGVGALNRFAYGSGLRPGSWLVRGWFTGPGGRVLGPAEANALQDRMYAPLSKIKAVDPENGISRWLSLHRDAFWLSYQPGSRFWIFQSVEGTVLIGLAVLLTVATLWRIRRA